MLCQESGVSMFEAGSYIIYGTKGVCKVVAIGNINVPGVDKRRLYYTLSPVGSQSGTIYTPVENPKVAMRNIISKEEALSLIREIPSIEALKIPDDKEREQLLQNALLSCDCREAVRIIKTLYLKQRRRMAAGKNATAMDQRYLQYAQDQLYGELAIVLDIARDRVEEYIRDSIRQQGYHEEVFDEACCD